jgi:hypothetical protein
MTTPDRIKLKATLIIVATFALGAITGAAVNGIYLQANTRTGDWGGRQPAPMLDNLRRELGLSDEQAAAIRAVTEDTRRELREVRFDQCPGLLDVRHRLIDRVRPLLTPTQQARFDTFIGQRQMRRDVPSRGGR